MCAACYKNRRRKQKLLRHTQGLFAWLDKRGLPVDSPNVIAWAGDRVNRATANYADRLFVAQWAVELNGQAWVLPKHRQAQKPKVRRPFTEAASDADLEALFPQFPSGGRGCGSQ